MKRVASIVLFVLIPMFADSVNGWEPLHEAVYEADMNRTRGIVENSDADIDAQSKAGIAPLHIAVKIRNLPMVDYLLEHGADVDIQDNNGYTPLLYAIGQHRLKIVKTLLQHDADVNLANSQGITPLQQAAYSNDFPIVDYLLDHGADPEILNANGINACELAYIKGNFSMAHHLLAYTKGVCGKYVDELNATKGSRE
ncbi:ankyrin repeat domain-containing protein [Hydrogenimonas urashimensis]|uniref:ankyrin repeat domain-containing protein n=1 Tax=Hydrogenimonas urashimensis TaxID=2740515 RepID=UPI001915272F|nr:ankyrin repeat domain-containing protein [Hydrogenimonas urashimensis]